MKVCCVEIGAFGNSKPETIKLHSGEEQKREKSCEEPYTLQYCTVNSTQYQLRTVLYCSTSMRWACVQLLLNSSQRAGRQFPTYRFGGSCRRKQERLIMGHHGEVNEKTASCHITLPSFCARGSTDEWRTENARILHGIGKNYTYNKNKKKKLSTTNNFQGCHCAQKTEH